MRRWFQCVGLTVAAALLLPAIVVASQALSGALPGRMIDAPDGQSRMEQLSIDPGLAPSLLGVALESSVRIDDWPVAPGVRRTVVVTRHDVYAPDAKIVAIDGGNKVEIPRSKLVFLWGTAEGDGGTVVLITVDPDTTAVSALSMTTEGSFDLLAPTAGRPGHLLARDGALRAAHAAGQGLRCGIDQLPEDPVRAALRAERARAFVPKVLSSIHSAVIAIDTDNELLSEKFANNPTNAADYIAQLFAGLNVIFERDLFVRLLQGYTILRLSTTPDPYDQPSTAPLGAYVDEVRDYWRANYSGIKRSLVTMLSGRRVAVAYLAVLCDAEFGYSFSSLRASAFDFSVELYYLAHEIGHNFGAGHTHCTDTSPADGIQPIDYCQSSDCGTRWSPASGEVCPAPFTITPANGAPVTNVRGTVMSYCISRPAGCGVTNIFHPQSISIGIGPELDAAVNQCIFPVGNAAPTVTSIAPTSGLTTGGSAVTITGTNFRSPASVAFADLGSGKAAIGVVVVSPTTITATTPAHTEGLKDVVVMNPEQQTGTLKDGFTYIQAVTVTSISPNRGTTAGGTPVTITGTAFLAPATVALGGSAATAVNVVNATTITATTPVHAPGAVDVVVQSNAQTGTLAGGYSYAPPPLSFYTLSPCRLEDTRTTSAPALVASSLRNFNLTNRCGIPTTAKAISVNLTVTGSTAPGFVSLFPGDGVTPATSNINFSTGQTRANNAVVLLATDGTGSLAVLNGAAGAVHFILDVNGFFQ